jgi:hypothetical protein
MASRMWRCNPQLRRRRKRIKMDRRRIHNPMSRRKGKGNQYNKRKN